MSPEQPTNLSRKFNVDDEAYYAVVLGFRSECAVDLTGFARTLPEGFAICSCDLVAGLGHVEEILKQAIESWRRGQSLARNKSIDLLMRLTCQSQIADAIKISGLSRAKDISLFGATKEEEQLERAIDSLIRTGFRCDSRILKPDRKRFEYLRTIHNLPIKSDNKEIISMLEERSAILAFQR